MTLPVEPTADADSAAGFERRVAPVISDLYRQARRLTDQHADAEDLVQDTLAKAFAGFDSFRPDSNIHAWLYRILVNTHISNCRKTQRRPAHDLARARHGSAAGGQRHPFGNGSALGGGSGAEMLRRPRRQGCDARLTRAVPHHGVLRGYRGPPVQGNRGSNEHADRNGSIAPASRAAPTTPAPRRLHAHLARTA